jgi:TRAP-type mannitol/chloroaromatic compound transport system permease small subunit
MNAPSNSPLLNIPPAWIDQVTPPIDFLSVWAGKVAAWLIVPMFLVLLYEVTARKLGYPTLWANDVATMCYGAHFFLTGAYALKLQKHIRTDFLSRNWTLKTQVRMDLAQYLLVFLPGMVMLTYISTEFAWESWELKEQLMTTWRPPAYWYKAVIPLSALLILLQGIAEVLKCIKTLYTGVDYREHQAAGEIT